MIHEARMDPGRMQDPSAGEPRVVQEDQNANHDAPRRASSLSTPPPMQFINTGTSFLRPERGSATRKAIQRHVMHNFIHRQKAASVQRLQSSFHSASRPPKSKSQSDAQGPLHRLKDVSTQSSRLQEPSGLEVPYAYSSASESANYNAEDYLSGGSNRWSAPDDPDEVFENPELLETTHQGSSLADLEVSRAIQRSSRAGTSSPRSYLDTGDLDPFSSMPVQLNRSKQRLVQHLSENQVFRTIYPISEQPEHPEDLARSGHLHISSAGSLYAVISLVSLWQQGFLQKSATASSGTTDAGGLPDFFIYRARAIQEVNKMLYDPRETTSDSAIISIVDLIGIEALLRNPQIMFAHLRGLEQIIKKRGGFQSLPLTIQNSVSLIDIKTAHGRSAPPYFPPPTLPGPAPNDLISAALTSTNPYLRLQASRLFNLNDLSTFHPDFLAVWKDLRDFTNFTLLRSLAPTLITKYHFRYFRVKNHSLEHRLISLPFVQSYLETRTDLQEAFRYATLLYIHSCLPISAPGSPQSRLLVTGLKSSLEGSGVLSAMTGPLAEAVLWMLLLGSRNSGGQIERPWFALNLAKKIKSLCLRSWEGAREVLLGFFYLEQALGQSFRESFTEAWLLRNAV